VAKLNTEIAAIIRSTEVKDMLGRAGMDASASSVEELAGIVQKDYPRWGAVIKRNGLTVE
jgi:tripartite-type tricarboxylate transporter receptor subunit TctC